MFTVENILKFGARLMIIFMVIPLHEFAHAWSANKMGDPTPKAQDRLNLNPFNHIDPIGAICLFIGGFGWGKPVQVNPNYFKKPKKVQPKPITPLGQQSQKEPKALSKRRSA